MCLGLSFHQDFEVISHAVMVAMQDALPITLLLCPDIARGQNTSEFTI